MTVSDEEPEKDLAGPTADRIKEGLTNLQTSLEALQTSAEQMVEDEQKALKKTSIGREQSGYNCKTLRLACLASGVWLGRVNNQQVPIALWPCTHENEVAPILPKWLHTVQK